MFNEKNKRNKNVKARKKRSNEGTTVSARLMKGVARGVAFSFLTAFLFILSGVGIGYNLSDPTGVINVIAISAICIASITCGFVCSKSCPQRPIVCGLISGMAFVFSVFVISLLLPRTENGFGLGARGTLFIVTLALNFLGAILGNVKVLKRRRRSPIRR